MKLRRYLLVSFVLFGDMVGSSCSAPSAPTSQPVRSPSETVFSFELSFPPGAYSQPQERRGFVQRVISRIKALPEIESVAAVGTPPRQPQRVSLPRYNPATFAKEYDPAQTAELNYSAVTPDYFRALKLELLIGRLFLEDDEPKRPMIVILSESAARKLLPDRDPIGQHIAFSGRDEKDPWLTVVGVVKDEPELSGWPRTEIYRPYSQDPDAAVSLVVRAKSDSPMLAEKLKEEIRAVDSQVIISKVQS